MERVGGAVENVERFGKQIYLTMSFPTGMFD